jgi:hypothetical protein
MRRAVNFFRKLSLEVQVLIVIVVVFGVMLFVGKAQVTPVDNNPPVITIIGANPFSINVGEVYTDPGATANDEEDGDITGSIVTVNNVNTAVAGTYTVEYSVTDSSEEEPLSDSDTRTVNVSAVVQEEPVVERQTSTGGYRKNSDGASRGSSSGGSVGSSENSTNNFLSEPDEPDVQPPAGDMMGMNNDSSSDVPDRGNARDTLFGPPVQSLDRPNDLHESENQNTGFLFTRNLSRGSVGNDVKELQKRLSEEGLFNYPEFTGFFGPITYNAVIRFQVIHENEIPFFTGIVGPRTRAILNQ